MQTEPPGKCGVLLLWYPIMENGKSVLSGTCCRRRTVIEIPVNTIDNTLSRKTLKTCHKKSILAFYSHHESLANFSYSILRTWLGTKPFFKHKPFNKG